MGRNRKGTLSKQDRFAELMAATAGTEHDGSVPHVGQLMGMNTHQANACFTNIRKALGAGQAR